MRFRTNFIFKSFLFAFFFVVSIHRQTIQIANKSNSSEPFEMMKLFEIIRFIFDRISILAKTPDNLNKFANSYIKEHFVYRAEFYLAMSIHITHSIRPYNQRNSNRLRGNHQSITINVITHKHPYVHKKICGNVN